MKLRSFLFTLVVMLITQSIHTQVTIGSGLTPMDGSLLQLKEKEPAGTDITTATKGLGLPRVSLKSLYISDPAMEISSTIDGAPSQKWDKNEHIGLLVYNINQCVDFSNKADGPFVWDGTKWQILKPITESDVLSYYEDTREQVHGAQLYPYRDFGAAGVWMLENMRYLPTDNSFTASAGGDYNYDAKYYFYPNGNPAEPAVMPSTWSPQLGILYTYSAVTMGVQDGSNDLQGEGNPSENDILTNPIQGICPPGWHVPSDTEWNVLEKEIYDNAGKYSIYSTTDLADINVWNPISATDSWNNGWNTGSGSGLGWGLRGSAGTGGQIGRAHV
mgnify:FL=1